MEKYSRVVSVSGRNYRVSPTMCDIFLAHASDIAARNEPALVPLLHEGGVEMLLIGASSRITVSGATPIDSAGGVVAQVGSMTGGLAESSAA